MKKFKRYVRLFFSRTFWVLLFLLIELLFILGLQIFFRYIFDFYISKIENYNIHFIVSSAYLVTKIIVLVIEVLVYFKMVNKTEDPEFKIPWITTLLLLPIFASIMYLIFANHGLRKKDQKIVDATRGMYDKYFIPTEAEEKQFENDLGNAIGTFNYLNSVTHLGIHKNNKVTYYKNGEAFFPAFLEGLKKAKEFIFIEFFIIDDGIEWVNTLKILKEKAKEGLDIRLIYDDMGCVSTISEDTDVMLRNLGIKCYKFHPFKPLLSGIYNNRDHRKIVVIDHQMGFTGGINLADEYANEITRFGYWKDTMVKIEGSGIQNLIATFLQNYNLASGEIDPHEEFLQYDKYETYENEGYVMPFGDGPGGIDDALIGEQNYINILNYAKKSVYISTPYLIPTYQLTDAIRRAALRKVDVHLILPGIPDKKMVYKVALANCKFLLDAGVKIHIYKPGFNHMKSMIADGELAFVGTVNLDFRSLVHHFECGTILYKNQCMKEIEDDFKEMISVCEDMPLDFRLRGLNRFFCAIIRVFSSLL